jgi:hypothetical protein
MNTRRFGARARQGRARRLLRRMARALWRAVRVLLLVGVALGPGPPPPPPPEPQRLEQHDERGEQAPKPP